MSSDTALLVIDVQVGLMQDAYGRDEVLQTIKLLLERAHASETPVIYVQHDDSPGGDLEFDTPGWQIHPLVAPREGEVVVRKASPDAFYQTRLQEELQTRGIKRLVIAGGQTEYCVDATTRRAVSQGYNVLLVSDAHTTFDNKTLTAAQIIAFYNETMNGFWAGDQVVRVRPAEEIVFAA
ncbi:MAG TPA: cysteine hydrolase family protein [Ktedonobacteraceae bacterium]|jgi:nicotinamidase-related amidase